MNHKINSKCTLIFLCHPLLLFLHLAIYLNNHVFCFFSPLFLRIEITIRVDEADCLSMASSHDQETERFLSTGTTGRRVSFNEAALFDHGKKAQEKGRRSESQLICRSPQLHSSTVITPDSRLYVIKEC